MSEQRVFISVRDVAELRDRIKRAVADADHWRKESAAWQARAQEAEGGQPVDVREYRLAYGEAVERAEVAEGAVERVRVLAEEARARDAASLSRTFDGGTFGAWLSANAVTAALKAPERLPVAAESDAGSAVGTGEGGGLVGPQIGGQP